MSTPPRPRAGESSSGPSEPRTRALVPTTRNAALTTRTAGFSTAPGFLARFVMPLIGGGSVEVSAPLSRFDRDAMLEDSGALLLDELLELRTRAANRLVADPPLDHPDADELSLWIALHDLLALDHPDTARVWTRASTWARVESETRGLFAQAAPAELPDALARHLAVGALLELRREDRIVSGPEGERRWIGQEPPRRLGLFGPSIAEVRGETVTWIEQPHRPIVGRLIDEAMAVSPLTSLLRPARAPAGWSPLAHAGGVSPAAFLRERSFARAVCHAWARERDWLLIGGVIAGSLLRALGLAGAVFGGHATPEVPGRQAPLVGPRPREGEREAEAASERSLASDDGPESIGAVVGALIHLHVLKVLEFDARIGLGLGDRNWAVQAFLAMPLLLPRLAPVLGRPFAGAPDESFARRWDEYCEHVGGLVPRTVVDNLLATLVRRVVEPSPDREPPST
ncbi:hypothetical protein ACNOYE_40170 [Nannocystaceae bacterium ST9]